MERTENSPSQGFEVRRATRASKLAVLGLLLAAVVIASMPYWAGRDTLRDFTQIAAYLLFAMMWNLLAGYGGMVSIGQQAFFGIGGYAMLVLANYCGVSPFLAVPLGAGLAMLVAVPVSRIAFRLEGGYFAVGTWVIAEVFRLSVANVSALGGGSGTSLTALQGIPRSTRESLTLWLALAAVAGGIALLYWFLRARPGLALTAMRDNAAAASSQGVDVRRARLVVYLVAAGGTAFAGGLYFLGNLRISPDAAFSVNWTAFGIFIVLIGGLGTLEGPIIGALIFFLLNKFLSDYGTWYLIGLGIVAIVVALFFPQGIWGYLSRRFGLQLFPVGRRLVLGDPAAAEGLVPQRPAPAGRLPDSASVARSARDAA
ncbi:branched-chain amino acid ABC transporter permease [Cupriavidus sp. AcVe19-6a]|uniref:branched-chain amino acid ABC transporter permease n=1 Tax=Cupriavidus sp. AcVe19-6a TaxID=2821358 RepID=UPI001AE80AA4|nr:branched-chain amino acid ABC transporter permease [Cupriavidus sp. AcVe19-6a]MBP0638712.1 branched-chain amino acid ABC transporter permease [Cupriavidus sp. AcVe19-6a]